MTIDEINKEFENKLKEFEKEVIPYLRANLVNQGYRYTDRLYNSMDIKIKDMGETSWELSFEMPHYGRALEMRDTFASGAPVETLARWVASKGLQNFKSIPGYENSNFIPATAATRIAWGITMSKKRTRTLQDPILYSWFYKPFFGLWRDKREELIDAYFSELPPLVINELADMYQKSMTALARHGGTTTLKT